MSYLFLNGFVGYLAFLIVSYSSSGDEPLLTLGFSTNPTLAPYVQAIVSGTIAMVLFRSSLMTVRVADRDVPFGPSLFLQSIMTAIDRQIDRKRAQKRSDYISHALGGFDYDSAKDALPEFCKSLMQNLTTQDEAAIDNAVERSSKASGPERVRLLNLGLALITVVGENVLRAAIEALKDEMKRYGSQEGQDPISEVVRLMQDVDYETARTAIPALCIIEKPIAPEVQTELAESIRVLDEQDVPDRLRPLMLGLHIQRIFGMPLLVSAVNAIRRQVDPLALPGPQSGPQPEPTGS